MAAPPSYAVTRLLAPDVCGDNASIAISVNADSETAYKVHDALAGKVRQTTIIAECSSAAWILALTANRIVMASDAHAMVHLAGGMGNTTL